MNSVTSPAQQAGADPSTAAAPPTSQMAAEAAPRPKAPTIAAFGTPGGAAIVFRDLASL